MVAGRNGVQQLFLSSTYSRLSSLQVPFEHRADALREPFLLCIVKHLAELCYNHSKSSPLEPSRQNNVVNLGDHALNQIRYIRHTMQRTSEFTAVPGWGGIGMGVVAMVAAWWAHNSFPDFHTKGGGHNWLVTWLWAAVLASALGCLGIWFKVRRGDRSVFQASGRQFFLSFLPPVVGGMLLTPLLYNGGLAGSLPALWLVCYGAGIVTGGAFSVRVVPIMGVAFMALGAAAACSPTDSGNLFMAAGFGGLHVAFGGWIAAKHGG